MSPLAYLFKGLVLGYRYTLSSFMGHGCRFRPTCSEYAIDAITAHGAVRGGLMAARRIARCRPGGGAGFDPVPDTTASEVAGRHVHGPAQLHRTHVP